MNKLDKARKTAVEFHTNLYAGQPYIVHLEEVLAVLLQYDPDASEDEQLAAILHDILEDTTCTSQEVAALFGTAVAHIVWGVTDEPGANRKERKARTYPKVAADERCVKVKLADRIANWESCIKSNPGLLKMYVKEYPGFRDALHNPAHGLVVQEMWAHLDDLYAFRK